MPASTAFSLLLFVHAYSCIIYIGCRHGAVGCRCPLAFQFILLCAVGPRDTPCCRCKCDTEVFIKCVHPHESINHNCQAYQFRRSRSEQSMYKGLVGCRVSVVSSCSGRTVEHCHLDFTILKAKSCGIKQREKFNSTVQRPNET
jgi:hypothetical protein